MRLETNIAGATFRTDEDGEGYGTQLVSSLPVGIRYRLEREPSNPHDRNAVQVWVDNHRYPTNSAKPKSFCVGYVPRKWSGTVGAALKNDNFHVWAIKPDEKWGRMLIRWVDITADPF